ncbi:MAG: hypothetical protein FWE24_02700 [Defluviitaleaceae bacterium]|nr:hypothetical protein [Defluviitaleaceae bacterium]
MKRNIKTRIICLIVAGVMLTGALTVAAINGSPYETLKNAFFNALAYENFTFESEMTVLFNGEVREHEIMRFVQGTNSFMEYDNSNRFSAGSMSNRFRFNSGSVEISPTFTANDGTRWYAARSLHQHENPRARNFWGNTGLTSQERNSAQVRFIELFIDLIVGDLRNNMHMSQSGDVRRVSGTITHSQLPEIVRLGIEMVIEEELRWARRDGREPSREDFANRHPMDIPIQSLTFNSIRGEADIDTAGNLLYLNAGANITTVDIFGDIGMIEMSIVFRYTDIGTSVPENPVPGALELLTRDFFEREFSRRYGLTIYFIRNDDGSINADSITSTWPGSLNNNNSSSNIGSEPPELDTFSADFEALIEELEALGIDLDLLRIQLDEVGITLYEILELYEMLDPDTINLEDLLEIWVGTWS